MVIRPGIPATPSATIVLARFAGGPTMLEVPFVVPVDTLVTVHCWTR